MAKNKKIKKIQACTIIINMILASFAFAIILSLNFGVVSGDDQAIWQDPITGLWKVGSITQYFEEPAKVAPSANGLPIGNYKILNPMNGDKIVNVNTGKVLSLKNGVWVDELGNNVPFEAKALNLNSPSNPIATNAEQVSQDSVKDALDSAGPANFETSVNLGKTNTPAIVPPVTPPTSGTGAATGDAGKLSTNWGLPKLLGLEKGGLPDALVTGLQWGGIVYFGTKLLGGWLGLQPSTTSALSTALGAGTLVWQFFSTISPTSSIGQAMSLGGFGPIAHPFLWGLGTAAIIFVLMYSEKSQKVVNFECLPWEAPTKGENCEKCNSDLHPCSEYRCKALGQGCEIVNKGTAEERCVWINNADVNSPIMKPWDFVLTKGYIYKPNTQIRPPDTGVKVVNPQASDGCIKAFTPLSFGLTTNEPSQCKVDYNRTMKFDQMRYLMGGSNLYLYNHTQVLNLPGPSQLNSEFPELKTDGVFNMYVRCKDKNGNENNDLFVFNFCVEKGPDVTAPVIQSTSIQNGMPVQYGLNETILEVYINEPADCKWSRGVDMDYSIMDGAMRCSQSILEMNNEQLYKCTTTLNGLKNSVENVFYFKCRDQPLLGNSNDRNTNREGYKFVLKGSSNNLIVENVKPNGTIKGQGNIGTVYLEALTEHGSNNGDAWCYYSQTQNEKDYIQMLETGTNKHKQRLDLPAGAYTFYIQCVDLGGNAAHSSASFTIEIDKKAPEVLRLYNEAGKLKIVTDEISTCSYSTNLGKECNFLLSEGTNMPKANSTEHYAEWNPKLTYYIKCADTNGNQPLAADCSITARPQTS